MTDIGDVGRKAAQKARDTVEKARDMVEKGRQAAEVTVRGVEQSGSAAFDNIRNLNLRLIDAARANADAACALARDIATITTPSDLPALWMRHDAWPEGEQLRDEALRICVRRYLRGLARWQSRTTRGVRPMEQKRLEHEAAKLVMKLRWIGMEDEAKRLQAMLNTLRAEERGSVLAGPVSTD
jgi:hypothetical protein